MFTIKNFYVFSLKILHEMGGIYLDLDTLVVRPFEDLRKYPCVIGRNMSQI